MESDSGGSARYEIVAQLATGGMADILLARMTAIAGVERYVVLKQIARGRTSDVQLVKMFLDEARLAVQLQHPNVAQVYDVGSRDDAYFFTMEYVHGETVRALIQRAASRGQPIPIAIVLTIAAGAAAGLHHAHERVGVTGKLLHIVHRDVSPSNLIVSYDGIVKVVDFGVAKATNRTQDSHVGKMKGKIGYLSPEQAMGHAIDRRSDLFSLGIVMWELLAGEGLYRSGSDLDSLAAIVKATPPAPSSRRADVPADVDAIVMKLLAKSPDDRFRSAGELLDAIERTALRAGIALSASALGRYIVELFGRRLEPWLDLHAKAFQSERPTATMSGNTQSRILRDFTGEVPTTALPATPSGATPVSLADALEPSKVITVPPPARRRGRAAIIAATAAAVAIVVGAVVARGLWHGERGAAAHDAAVHGDAAAISPAADVARPIDELVRGARYADAVAACTSASKLGESTAALCALAACHVSDAPRARRWLAIAGAGKRAALVAACERAGIDLRPP